MAAAAGDGAVKPLQCAMKLANGAIELDTGNRPREAYTEYLRSVHYISQVLLEEVETTKEAGETVTPDTSKMLKLAEQCLERAQSTAAKLGKACLRPALPVAAPIPSPTSRHRRVYSDEGGKLSPFLPPEIFQKLQVVEPQSSKKELTPLEEASLQNQKLKAAYEARMARLDPSQAMQKTSLTLSLQRQMMENLVIAKAREETLQRKMEERRLRLQEAANRPVLPPRRFCSQVALTPEEREQRALYAAILEYEQDHDWPKHWKAKLKRSPGDLSLVTSLVSHMLSVPDHPISQLLKKLQCAVYRALYPIVSRGAGGCCSLPPDTDGLLPPGSRRLRPSQSLYCMPSPPEPSLAPRPPDGPSASPPTPPPHPGNPDRGADGSPTAPPSPLVDTPSHLPGKDSSFEDLEQFLATPERRGWGPGGRPEAQPPRVWKGPSPGQLEGTVQDIHEAIGLNTAASKDRCLACIEEPFFSPLWPLLLAVYRTLRPRQPAPTPTVPPPRSWGCWFWRAAPRRSWNASCGPCGSSVPVRRTTTGPVRLRPSPASPPSAAGERVPAATPHWLPPQSIAGVAPREVGAGVPGRQVQTSLCPPAPPGALTHGASAGAVSLPRASLPPSGASCARCGR
ncbi:VPS9 domain-containing protein 1 isoform X7 [Hippopotamus amphibius kiboko]|uniref:VPS9 domain-containing protein 1 isoform X7 n=1 Tax=Hippopotamus amphibius kiboko TaxID=575201 RepID=UPI00259AD4DE|nr:VPS9 domain-containing protein 1 isoform X7 [Hippopotamus amphibius kiboko]